MTILVRTETPGDRDAIRSVNKAAFGVSVEADLIDRLRADGDLLLSLVAEGENGIVGYCGFSRLTIEKNGEHANGVSLGPVAVLPREQKHGIGQKMVRDGIARLKAEGETLIIVLGEPAYYSRVGFDVAAAAAFRTPYDGPYLQVLRLSDDAPTGGDVRYAAAFASL